MMDKEKIIELIKEMITVDYCDKKIKNAGQVWLDSIDDSEAEKLAATILITELEECIVPIDDAIALAKSHPDSDFWKNVLELELKAKEDGMTICGCVACINGQKILDDREYLFK
jgi:pyruvate-ferredoxin/flavodoxin oxidoreductase